MNSKINISNFTHTNHGKYCKSDSWNTVTLLKMLEINNKKINLVLSMKCEVMIYN